MDTIVVGVSFYRKLWRASLLITLLLSLRTPARLLRTIISDGNVNDGALALAALNDSNRSSAVEPVNDASQQKQEERLSVAEALIFHGSKVTPMSPGMDALENVCIQKAQKKRQTNKIISFGSTALRSSLYTYMRRVSWQKWTSVTEARNISEWQTYRTEHPFYDRDVLFGLEIWDNPGHCTNDLVYSIALDAWHRNLAHDTSESGAKYPEYFYSHFGGWVEKHRHIEKVNWCSFFLQNAKFINVTRGPVVDNKAETDIVCFRRLLMPLVSVHRFPINWKNPVHRKDTVVPSNREHLTMRGYRKTGTMYPGDALVNLHKQVLQSMGFTSEPWPREANRQETVTLLMYGRLDARRRRMKNADELKAALEEKYHVSVRMIDDSWSDMSPPQQADLYHSHSLILSVHGAHLANLWYARPGTRVVEIMCGDAQPEPDENLLVEPSANKSRAGEHPQPSDWYGQMGWFSSATRRIGIEHFVIGEPSTKKFSPRAFNVTPARIASFVASRLGLAPRNSVDWI